MAKRFVRCAPGRFVVGDLEFTPEWREVEVGEAQLRRLEAAVQLEVAESLPPQASVAAITADALEAAVAAQTLIPGCLYAVGGTLYLATGNAAYRRVPEPDYTTDEIDTGQKWIDGKAIYRRVVTGTVTAAANAFATSTIGQTGVDRLLSAAGWWEYSTATHNICAVGNNISSSYTFAAYVPYSEHMIRYDTKSAEARADAPYAITLYYTKL
jgi:hypothetical protein